MRGPPCVAGGGLGPSERVAGAGLGPSEYVAGAGLALSERTATQPTATSAHPRNASLVIVPAPGTEFIRHTISSGRAVCQSLAGTAGRSGQGSRAWTRSNR
jgi:hypothetical protein